MIETITSNLTTMMDFIQKNPIILAFGSGGVIFWVMGHIKNIFATIVDWTTACISFTIFNKYEIDKNMGTDSLQLVINKLVSDSTPIWERHINVQSEDNNLTQDTYGESWRWLFNRPVYVKREFNKDGNKVTMSLFLRVFFTSKARVRGILDEVAKEEQKRNNCLHTDQILVRTENQGYHSPSWKHARKIDSIFNNNDESKELLEDIKRFINNRPLYQSLNYPYNYSCLLYGKPGCGKSSTINAIANELGRQVYYINLAETNINNLLDTINHNNNVERSVFVFEDIDAINSDVDKNRDKNDDQDRPALAKRAKYMDEMDFDCGPGDAFKLNGVSLSSLLNITDGLLASDGSIFIFTTNHIEKLDTALLRAGRMNKLVELTYLNGRTANRMINTYLNFTIDNIHDEIKPAELQEEILKLRLDKITKEEFIDKFKKHE